MNTQNQIPEPQKLQTTIWIILSLLSAIGGMSILVFVSGFKVIPLVMVVFVVAYFILVKSYRNNG